MKAPTQLQLAMKKRLAKRRRLPKMPAAKAPIALERTYIRELLPFLEVIQRNTKLHVISALPSIFKNVEAMRPTNARNDAAGDDVKRVVDQARESISRDFTRDEMRRIADKKGIEVSQWNKQVIKRGLQKVAEVDVFFYEPWLADQLGMFAVNNVNLISSIPEDALYEVEQTVFAGLQSGERWETIASKLEERLDPEEGITRSRLEFIARDQVNKLNGQMNYLRQSEAGINKYVWRTVGDERVRESHAKKDGEVFSWDSPPSDTGHPGEDYNCRCWAEPYLDDILDDL